MKITRRDLDKALDKIGKVCPHCGLKLDIHDGSGFCPAGTERRGGRR